VSYLQAYAEQRRQTSWMIMSRGQYRGQSDCWRSSGYSLVHSQSMPAHAPGLRRLSSEASLCCNVALADVSTTSSYNPGRSKHLHWAP
jgi:hypothetical protein